MSLKKAIIKITLIGAVMTILGPVSVFAAAKGTIVGDGVSVRAGASGTAGIRGSENQGTVLEVLDKKGDWYRVSYKGSDGCYVSSQYFKVNQIDAVVKGTNVNVRSTPSTDAPVVTTINSGDTVVVTGQTGDWYQLASNNGNAYVNKSFLSGALLELASSVNGTVTPAQQPAVVPVQQQAEAQPTAAPVQQQPVATQLANTYGIVTSDNGINLRTDATTASASLGILPYNEVVDVIEGGNEWVKVKTDSGNTGYAAKEFLSIRTGEKPSRSVDSSKGDQVVSYAKQFLGTPYVWSGTNLNKGVDCSGFVYAVMKNFGISLNRSSAGMASNGVAISKSELAAGDLVLFDTTGPNDGGISHVGIYIGNGDYIHSSSGKVKGVIISNLNEAYSARTYVTARRVLR